MTPGSWAFLVDSVPFTRAVRDGETSLGGSESACLGLARALKRQGHTVHVYATQLADDARGFDADGVAWHPMEDFLPMNRFIEWDVVVVLRMPQYYAEPIRARLRVLWNQDLLLPGTGAGVMAIAWQLDRIAYVSEYHRKQWEDVAPDLAPIGWVTRNGFDPAHVPAGRTKDPNRIIYISRPERGLGPILAMWPALKARHPQATLQICRYHSMYDGEGSNVRELCLAADAAVQDVNAEVGGIEYLGTLNKPDLYRAIADAAVMWYPGVASFAETSCIAAIEAQACGTLFVGSLRGALPETAKPSLEAGLLLAGDAERDEAYQQASVNAVLHLLDGCARQTFEYRKLQQAGRAHVEVYTYDRIAAEWAAQVDAWFTERYEANKIRVMRQLLHEDDHTAAKLVAEEIDREETADQSPNYFGDWDKLTPIHQEALDAIRFCDRVIAGKEQGPEDYAAHAIQDPLDEVQLSGRFQAVAPYFADRTFVLDVACGNGAGAIALALAHPGLTVVGLDYAQANVEHATDAATRAGVGDRCTFICSPVWDFDQNAPSVEGERWLRAIVEDGAFDGLFVGEFLEHVADCTTLVDWLEQFLADGAQVVYTCPRGPFGELVPRGQPIQRGHVHCFQHDDVKAVFGQKLDAHSDVFDIGFTPRGNPIGHWIIRYRTAPNRPAGQRDLATRARRTRPMPRLSVGLITKDAEADLLRCLDSVWRIADEIVVGDTGSNDKTKAIAADCGARVLDLAPIFEQPEGFAGARNAVLDACTGDWFLWIDADEELVNPFGLRLYTEGLIFNGFVLHQQHLYDDRAPSFDIPTRLFRRLPSIRFYGCVHEQPQMGDCNGEILPALDLVGDVYIRHYGYLTPAICQEKMLRRNLPLLQRDQTVFPARELGKVLVLRDYVNLSDYDRAAAGGRMTAKARNGYAQAIRIFLDHFDDPGHRFHQIARPWYEAALRHLGVGWEAEVAFAARAGGLEHRQARPERVWVRDAKELERVITHRVTQATTQMAGVTFKTDPSELGVSHATRAAEPAPAA